MEIRNGVAVSIGIICFINGMMCRYSPAMETQIRNETLLNGIYDPVSRPAEQTIVKIGINLLAIDELNLKGQKLTLVGWLTLEWFDERLIWDKDTHDDMEFIFTKPQYIWKPELLVDNSLTGIGVIVDKFMMLRVRHDGLVDWEPTQLFNTHCQVDITYYPYDRQKCGIGMVSWSYNVEEVTLKHLFEDINLEDFVQHGEWLVEYTSIDDRNLTEHTTDGEVVAYPELDFWLHLKRRTEFYNLNTMLPLILTSLMVGLVFIVPLNSGEKVSFVLTVFLSLAVLLTIVSDTLPPTSITSSILGLYLGLVLVSAAVGILLTVIILMIYHRQDKPRAHHTLLIATRFAASCICWHFPLHACDHSSETSLYKDAYEFTNINASTRTHSNTQRAGTSDDERNGQQAITGNSRVDTGTCCFHCSADTKTELTWTRVAQIWDRFIFFLFFTCNVVMNVTFVLLLTTGDGTVLYDPNLRDDVHKSDGVHSGESIGGTYRSGHTYSSHGASSYRRSGSAFDHQH